MQGRAGNRSNRDDAERYKAAAHAALDQLDWAIGYFHRIRKPLIAAALQRNRDQIARRVR